MVQSGEISEMKIQNNFVSVKLSDKLKQDAEKEAKKRREHLSKWIRDAMVERLVRQSS